jgi:hypothetical protein
VHVSYFNPLLSNITSETFCCCYLNVAVREGNILFKEVCKELIRERAITGRSLFMSVGQFIVMAQYISNS